MILLATSWTNSPSLFTFARPRRADCMLRVCGRFGPWPFVTSVFEQHDDDDAVRTPPIAEQCASSDSSRAPEDR
jgi:hypothetical protein